MLLLQKERITIMKHYVGETVYISSRYDNQYKKYNNYIGEITNIECGNCVVKFLNEDKNNFVWSAIIPESDIRLYSEEIHDKESYNMLIVLTYTGLIESAINEMKHNVKNKMHSIIKFSDDINEYLLNYNRRFFSRKNITCVCDHTLPTGTILCEQEG